MCIHLKLCQLAPDRLVSLPGVILRDHSEAAGISKLSFIHITPISKGQLCQMFRWRFFGRLFAYGNNC
jgi:hypothetical protein